MQESFTKETRPRMVLNRQGLDRMRKASGIQTESELARRLGVSASTLWRISRGDVEPSAAFIARALVAFPQAKFASLFSVQVAEAAA